MSNELLFFYDSGRFLQQRTATLNPPHNIINFSEIIGRASKEVKAKSFYELLVLGQLGKANIKQMDILHFGSILVSVH